MAHASNPSTREAVVGGLGVQNQSRLKSKSELWDLIFERKGEKLNSYLGLIQNFQQFLK